MSSHFFVVFMSPNSHEVLWLDSSKRGGKTLIHLGTISNRDIVTGLTLISLCHVRAACESNNHHLALAECKQVKTQLRVTSNIWWECPARLAAFHMSEMPTTNLHKGPPLELPNFIYKNFMKFTISSANPHLPHLQDSTNSHTLHCVLNKKTPLPIQAHWQLLPKWKGSISGAQLSWGVDRRPTTGSWQWR